MKKAKGIGAANKRRRLEESEALKDVVLKSAVTKQAVAEAKSQLGSSGPFPHVIVSPVCEDAGLQEAFDQALNGLSADLRESDSYKVYQTQGLQDIEPSTKGLAAVKSLRDSLYSEEFRGFVTEVFGCGPLASTVDCSNVILNEGCHLLCSEDTNIGTKRIGFLLFLTPKDDGWEEADGGMLELYAHGQDASLAPQKQIPPLWNSMVLFELAPNSPRPFGVGEVFSAEKTELAVIGWFHSAEANTDAETARVKEEGGDDWGEFGEIPGKEGGGLGELTAEDTAYLGKYVNSKYLNRDTLREICAQFEQDSSTILHDFLVPEVAAPLVSQVVKEDAEQGMGRSRKPKLTVGVGGAWKEAGPPSKRRCLVYGGAEGGDQGDGAGARLSRLRQELFSTLAFHRLMAAVSGLEPTSSRSVCRRFRPGLDYTKACASDTGPPCTLDAGRGLRSVSSRGSGNLKGWLQNLTVGTSTLCFVDEGEDAAEGDDKMTAAGKQEMWQSSLIGGYECYAEAEGAAPYVLYDGAKKQNKGGANGSSSTGKGKENGGMETGEEEEEDEPLAQGVAKSNSLFVAYRDEGVASFVKYVAGVAPGSRWDIAMQAEVDAGEEGEAEA